MSRTAIRQISAKRLRPGLVPEDVTIDVVGITPFKSTGTHLPEQVTLLYLVQEEGCEVWSNRMEDIEGRFGEESVFEDSLGSCYVCSAVFQLQRTEDVMNQIVEGTRRKDSSMAERVDRGIALLMLAGRDEASRYLRNCGAPAEVVGRVLTTSIARRPRGSVKDRRKDTFSTNSLEQR
jgi:hypothetical protein